MRSRRSSSTSTVWVVVSFVLFLALLGVLATLVWRGKIKLPFDLGLFEQRAEAKEDKETLDERTPLPISMQDIPAYTKITREFLGETRVRAEAMPQNVCWQLSEIRGRVLRRGKPKGFAFTLDDFLPEGTRPGIPAGIPAGKRAMRVGLNEIKGLHDLRPGDMFDIIATIPVEMDEKELARLDRDGIGKYYAVDAGMTNALKKATVRVIVRGGTSVSGVLTRDSITPRSSRQRGEVTQTRVVEEMVLAMDPEEVPDLRQAIAVGADVACVLYSGLPGGEQSTAIPDLRAAGLFDIFSTDEEKDGGNALFQLVETISGSQRTTRPVPDAHGARPKPPTILAGDQGQPADRGERPASVEEKKEKQNP